MSDDDAPITIAIRMYNVGFGDAFRISVARGQDRWSMLIDCGVHAAGESRDIDLSVAQIISDLRDPNDGTAKLDVVVATHHHRDHICGFANPLWEDVTVDEVWLPFAANCEDPDTQKLNGTMSLATAADRLHALIYPEERLAHNPTLELASALADNCRVTGLNAQAMNRLLGQNGATFAGEPHRRFLPDIDPAKNTISISPLGITAHVLGPSRDEAMLKKMNPPKNAGWLTLDGADVTAAATTASERPLFNQAFLIPDAEFEEQALGALPLEQQDVLRPLREARNGMKLKSLPNNDQGLLAAAALLERAVNNTSVFFVLEVSGLTFLFPGDAQYGAWEHVRADPTAKKLIDGVDFYKVGHHGSQNATPGKFAKGEWAKHGDAMIPWGPVTIWPSIPWPQLLDDLGEGGHRRVVLPTEVRGRTKPRRPASAHADFRR